MFIAYWTNEDANTADQNFTDALAVYVHRSLLAEEEIIAKVDARHYMNGQRSELAITMAPGFESCEAAAIEWLTARFSAQMIKPLNRIFPKVHISVK